MLFNSLPFIFLFLPACVAVYFLLNRARLTLAARVWLVLASLFFYGYWNPVYLLLILASIAVNFTLGEAMQKRQKPKLALILGIAFNLGLLGYFKYTDFIIQNINWVTGTHIPLAHIVLPLAISFFTFQQVAYLVDSYRGLVKERDFINYCLFVTYFPQLIAGPIVHHKEMMPQFASLRHKPLRWKNMAIGLLVFGIGLFKKVAVADTFAGWASAGFDSTGPISFWGAWATSLSYTFQLYYDFSGYTDMAVGAALMMNIHLPANFNSPYKACDIQDFWRRWHMTLSRWLRDYLYIPLGGNRCAEWRTASNLFITFLLGGLWHGANWTFVIWGAMHGAAVIVHRYWKKLGLRMPTLIGWSMTFLYVNLAWVFFRATSADSALRLLRGMTDISSMTLDPKFASAWYMFKDGRIKIALYRIKVGFLNTANGTVKSIHDPSLLLMLATFALIAFLAPNAREIALPYHHGRKPGLFFVMVTGLLLALPLLLLVFMPSRISEFIYFNF